MPARLVTSPTGAPIDEPTLLRFLEAARWAPSGFNAQPWRFLYAAAYPRHEQNLARAQIKTRLTDTDMGRTIGRRNPKYDQTGPQVAATTTEYATTGVCSTTAMTPLSVASTRSTGNS